MIRKILQVVKYIYYCLGQCMCPFYGTEPNRQDYIGMTNVTNMPQTNMPLTENTSVYTVFTESIYSPSTSPSPLFESQTPSPPSSPSPPLQLSQPSQYNTYMYRYI